jgi:predicted dehydrogenase
MTRTAGEAERLAAHVAEMDRVFMVTHCYTGYPMVREAREMVRDGALGDVHLIEAQFALGVPGMVHEPADPTERHWRFKTSSMGPAAILGEVGSHAHNLVEYVTGSRAKRVSARLDTIAARREVYDNAYLTVEYDSGAIGRIWTSYLAVGIEHGLALRIFGDEASLAWAQEKPEVLWHHRLGGPMVALSRAMDGLSEASIRSARFPPGHPEGYALAFANLYRDFATAVVEGVKPPMAELLPDVRDGLATMRLFEAAERSHERNGAYEDIERPPLGWGHHAPAAGGQ